MSINNYDIIYLIANIFSTYTIFKFMSVFFSRDNINTKCEFFSYFIYYIAISVVFLYFNAPFVNMASNIIMFFAITFNYQSSLKLRLVAVVFIYTILLSAEAITLISLRAFGTQHFTVYDNSEFLIAQLCTRLVSYAIVLIFSNFKLIKNNVKVQFLHWIAVVTIPICTLFPTAMILSLNTTNNLFFMIFNVLILFGINVLIFYLYDNLIKAYQEKIEKDLLKQQNNAYVKQMEIIKQSQENIKILRHDIKHHVSVFQTLVEKGDNTSAIKYLQDTFNFISTELEYVKSGNQEVDSILNYKINEAKKKNVEIITNICIPEEVNIVAFDLTAVLSNLLDNAIEAVSKLISDRNIYLNMELDRNVLYINMENEYSGRLNIKGNQIKTTHKDKENHGIGLLSVHKAVQKYNGTMNIQHNDNKFIVDVLMYNIVNSNL